MTRKRGETKKNAARIAVLPPGVLLVEQTVYSPGQGRYVIDHDEKGGKIERHVKMGDDHGIAEAVRAACRGDLSG